MENDGEGIWSGGALTTTAELQLEAGIWVSNDGGGAQWLGYGGLAQWLSNGDGDLHCIGEFSFYLIYVESLFAFEFQFELSSSTQWLPFLKWSLCGLLLLSAAAGTMSQ